MSRIGKKYITVPPKVTVKLNKQKISVDGPKGNLSRILPSVICCTLDEESQKLFIENGEEKINISPNYKFNAIRFSFKPFSIHQVLKYLPEIKQLIHKGY